MNLKEYSILGASSNSFTLKYYNASVGKMQRAAALFSDLDFTRNESFENGVGNIYELLLKKDSPEDCRVLVRTGASGAWHQQNFELLCRGIREF